MNRHFNLFALSVMLVLASMQSVLAASVKVTAQELLNNSSYERRMRLLVDGKPLNLLLQPSRATAQVVVVDNVGRTANPARRVENFTGQIEGEANSWVRLTVSSASVRGVISRQQQRYEINTTDAGQITLQPLAHQHYPLPPQITDAVALRRQRTVQTATTEKTTVTHVADIGVVVDQQYNATFNNAGVEKAISIINAVDGIYREDFGLALNLKTVISITDAATDPFNLGPVRIEDMLRNFRDYRQSSAALRDVSMVHLFTGNRNNDDPVGLAWVGTACRPDGYDVSISTPYAHDILLAAHEIAHNLGAKHDSDTACNIVQDKVMWPFISAQTSQQFSSCTLRDVSRSLASSCHAPALDLQLSLAADNENTLSALVKNNSQQRFNTSATVTIGLPQGARTTMMQGDCHNPQDTITCSIDSLLPGSIDKVVFRINGAENSFSTLSASVTANDAFDAMPDNNAATFALRDGLITVLDTSIINEDPNTPLPPSGGNAGATTGGALSITAILPLYTLLALLITRRLQRRQQRQ